MHHCERRDWCRYKTQIRHHPWHKHGTIVPTLSLTHPKTLSPSPPETSISRVVIVAPHGRKMMSPSIRAQYHDWDAQRTKQALPAQHVTWKLKFMQSVLPSTVNLRFRIPIYDQGNTGSCTAQALATCYRLRHATRLAPSRLWMYYNGRAVSSMENMDEGAYPFDVLQTMDQKVRSSPGAPPETCWRFEPRQVNRKPTLSATCRRMKRGYVTRWQDNWSPDLSSAQIIHNIKTSLFKGWPVWIGINVYENFFDTGNNGIVPEPTEILPLMGGHMMCIVGYDDNKVSPIDNNIRGYFKVVNSWGTDWGQGGLCYLSYQLVTHPLTQVDGLQSIIKVI
jgi:C1A family cysteine protease